MRLLSSGEASVMSDKTLETVDRAITILDNALKK